MTGRYVVYEGADRWLHWRRLSDNECVVLSPPSFSRPDRPRSGTVVWEGRVAVSFRRFIATTDDEQFARKIVAVFLAEYAYTGKNPSERFMAERWSEFGREFLVGKVLDS